MIVQVSSEVRLVGDGTSWTVQRLMVPERSKKGGPPAEPYWTNLGYYGWLSQAARAVLERHVQLLDGKSNEVDLASLLEVVIAATVQIEDACEKLGKQVIAGVAVQRVSERLAQAVKP